MMITIYITIAFLLGITIGILIKTYNNNKLNIDDDEDLTYESVEDTWTE